MSQQPLLSRILQWQEKLSQRELLSPQLQRELHDTIEEARIANLESPPPTLLSILLLGPTGAGKSELLNALAGARIARSHYLRPTTTQPVIYAHEQVTADELAQYSELIAQLAAHPGSLVTHQIPELRHKLIIDAPDIDSFRTEHREAVLSLLPAIDVVLYVVTPFSYKDDIGWQTVLQQRGRRAFAFVINKWDPEGKPDAAPDSTDADTDLLQLLNTQGGYANPRVFRTSARYWLLKKLGELPQGSAVPQSEQFSPLEQWLSSGLASSEIAHIHERRRLKLWDTIAACVTQAIPPERDWSVWRKNLQGAILTLEHDGYGMVQPYLLERAREINATRKRERPRTFGILGLLLHTFTSVKSWRPLAGAMTPAISPARASDTISVESAAEKLSALAELRMSGLGWAAQQEQLPASALQREWAPLLLTMREEMARSLVTANAAALARQVRQWRRYLSLALMLVLELSAVALLAIGVWRIARGFLFEQYVTLPFALSLLALFATLVVLAAIVRVALLPANEAAVLRELDRPVQKTWRDLLAQLSSAADEHVRLYTALRSEGLTLERECLQRARHSSGVLARMQSGRTGSAVDQLFAKEPAEI